MKGFRRSGDAGRSPCPCCDAPMIDEPGGYEICSICDWEDDPVQSADSDHVGGANGECLRNARLRWASRETANTRPL